MIKMNWVKDFYSKQNEWLGIYLGEIEEMHHQRALLLHDYIQSQPQCPEPSQIRVLELGAGGGQTAVALAQFGYDITTVELLADSAQHAQALAQSHDVQANMQVLQGDFYDIELPLNHYQLIYYFDSFGIGSDDDQQRLLRRIAAWLDKKQAYSRTVIEIGSTSYWGATARGRSMDLGDCQRSYDFDAFESRLLDHWHRHENPQEVYSQSLRCYMPADLRLLLRTTGLQLLGAQAGGKVDYNAMNFVAHDVPLAECMTYYALMAADC
jgi:SAM-dependent methyltransferase